MPKLIAGTRNVIASFVIVALVLPFAGVAGAAPDESRPYREASVVAGHDRSEKEAWVAAKRWKGQRWPAQKGWWNFKYAKNPWCYSGGIFENREGKLKIKGIDRYLEYDVNCYPSNEHQRDAERIVVGFEHANNNKEYCVVYTADHYTTFRTLIGKNCRK